MPDKINIFELDIDADAAIKETARLADNTAILKANLDALKKSQNATTEEVVAAQAAYDDQNKQYKASQRELAKLTNLQGKEIKTVEQGRVALTVINKEWAKQASLFGANSKEADALAKKHLELKNRVNELQKGIGDTSGNIGNYSKDFQEAIGKTTLFARATSGVTSVLQVAKPVYQAVKLEIAGIGTSYKTAVANTEGYSRAQKAAAIGTEIMSGALRIFKVALISTGIGAILVLLGSLIAYFSKTQRGVDAVSKVLAGLGAAFDVIIDRLSKVGGALVKLFSGDFSGAFNDMKDAASGLGDELLREAKAAYQLEAALQAVKDKEIGLITVQAARKKKIEELRLAAKDEEKDLKERANLLQQAGDIEKQVLADKLSIAKEEARISQEKLDMGESSRDDIKANAEAQAKVTDLEIESLKLQRSIEAEKQGLLKRARAEEESAAKARLAESQKLTDAAIKESKTKLDIFLAENKEEKKSLADSISFEEQARDKRLAIVRSEVEAGKKTVSEGELAELQIKQEFLQKQKDLTVDYANEELQIYLDAHQKRIAEGQLLTDALVQQEVDRLQAIRNKEAEFQAERLKQGEINQREYNSIIAEVDAEYQNGKTEVETQLAEQKKEAQAVDIENQRALDAERLDYDLGLQLATLDQRKQQELDAAEQTGADKTLIEAKYADASKEIAKTVRDNKVSLAADAFGNLAEILGKESKAGKAAAIAQTTITTYQSATSAFNSLSGIPIVGPVLGAIAAAAAIAAGLANVRKIASTKPASVKAEKGALFEINGKRHAQGGTQFWGEDGTHFEAEQGELIGVMNRRAAMAFKGYNDQYVSNATPTPNYLADGGFVQRSFTATSTASRNQGQGFDMDLFAAKVAEANRSLPAPVTDVKDVIGQVGNYNQIVNGANI